MSREKANCSVEQSIANCNYKSQYVCPEFLMSGQRHPGILVKKMLALVPEDERYDGFYTLIADTLFKACDKDSSLLGLPRNFWLPMSELVLPQIGELDAEWKQQMIDLWMMTGSR